jgi:hypothetical protein
MMLGSPAATFIFGAVCGVLVTIVTIIVAAIMSNKKK